MNQRIVALKQTLLLLVGAVLFGACSGVTETGSDPTTATAQAAPTQTPPASPMHRNGETRKDATGKLQAWNDQGGQWLSAEAFWQAVAQQRGGLTWGRRATYPPYAEVNEQDLLLIELPSGVCLMEFWHSRWRRAQDVRRWSDAFNEYGGCPHVFD